jgi:hypothetical protein
MELKKKEEMLIMFVSCQMQTTERAHTLGSFSLASSSEPNGVMFRFLLFLLLFITLTLRLKYLNLLGKMIKEDRYFEGLKGDECKHGQFASREYPTHLGRCVM